MPSAQYACVAYLEWRVAYIAYILRAQQLKAQTIQNIEWFNVCIKRNIWIFWREATINEKPRVHCTRHRFVSIEQIGQSIILQARWSENKKLMVKYDPTIN